MSSSDSFFLIISFVIIGIFLVIIYFLRKILSKAYYKIFGYTHFILDPCAKFYTAVADLVEHKYEKSVKLSSKDKWKYSNTFGSLSLIAFVVFMIIFTASTLIYLTNTVPHFVGEFISNELILHSVPFYFAGLIVDASTEAGISPMADLVQFGIMSSLTFLFARKCVSVENKVMSYIYNSIFAIFCSTLFNIIPDEFYNFPITVSEMIFNIPDIGFISQLTNIEYIGIVLSIIIHLITFTLLRIWLFIIIPTIAVAVREVSFSLIFSIPTTIGLSLLFGILVSLLDANNTSTGIILGVVCFILIILFSVKANHYRSKIETDYLKKIDEKRQNKLRIKEEKLRIKQEKIRIKQEKIRIKREKQNIQS